VCAPRLPQGRELDLLLHVSLLHLTSSRLSSHLIRRSLLPAPTMSDLSAEEKKAPPAFSAESADVAEGDLVNSSGHVQELDRSFGFWSVASVGILADNAWGSGGGSLVVS